MNNKKTIVNIIFSIILIGCFIVTLQSKLIFKIFKNENLLTLNTKYESLNSSHKNIKGEKYLIVYDESEPNSISIKNNIIKTLEYIKKPYEILEAKKLSKIELSYTAMIISFENLNKIANYAYVTSYIQGGGHVFFAERPINNGALDAVKNNLGIVSYNSVVDIKGINFNTNLLLKAKEFSTNEEFISNSSLDVKLNNNCSIHALSSEKIPLVWEYKLGNGKIMVFNGTMLSEKVNRGLIVGALSLLNDNYIYPIINSKIVYIDDFPAPIPDNTDENIYKLYKRAVEAFYRDIWWSDMVKASNLYNIKYTGLIIKTYENNTEAPFVENNKSNQKNLLLYGRELLKNGGELGIHGYNHQPLVPKDFIKNNLNYNYWKTENDMVSSISNVSNYAKYSYPLYNFTTYVPPSNILSPTGRQALIKGMPDLKIISAVYIPDVSGDAYVQEFEIGKDNIIELPRLTAGYEQNDEVKWTTLNGINSLGIFSHFIHPDDILDSKRNNGKTWDNLFEEFSDVLNYVNSNYKWLRPMTASTAGEELQKYIECTPYVEYKETSINVYCDKFRENTYFILRSNKTPKNNIKDYEITKIDENSYLVNAKKSIFTIDLK